MPSLSVHTERSAPQRYSFNVSRLRINQRTTLLPGDIFNFFIRVYLSTGTLLYYCPSQTVSCQSFFQEGQFLQTMLSRIHSFIDSIEEITEGVISGVQELFQVDGVASVPPPSLESQHEEIRLWLQITLFDTSFLGATEESTQCFGMIPASEEAIQTWLKKCTDIALDECCRIYKEEFDVNGDGYSMPCDNIHVYHQPCIVPWLQTNHVCPLCRNPLPTLKK